MVPILHTIDYILITVIVLFGVVVSSKFRSSPIGDQARIDRLEHKVDQLTTTINSLRSQSRVESSNAVTPMTSTSTTNPTGSLSPGVRALADQGQKIQAIKLLREETGLGLKEAKDAVDAYDKR